MSNVWSRWLARIVVGILAGSFFLFIGVPLVALLLREPPALLWATMQQPEVRQALELSFLTTSISTFLTVLFGLPVAFVLARMQFRGRSLLETLVTLPIVFPPVVAGVALLLTFGRFGLVGRYLLPLGITINPPCGSRANVSISRSMSAGAPRKILLTSMPNDSAAVSTGTMYLDKRYEQAAYTLRASPFYTFRHVVLPLIRPILLSGIGLAWARALGELGATITFAGSFPGVTQTMPVAVYIAAESDLDTAVALSVVLLAVSFGLLLALRLGRERLVG